MTRRDAAMPAKGRKLRCAVYTRKSTEEGLEQAFNSLDAQREACEAYIASQRAEGWMLVHDRYDDGGVSGGTLDRPALKRLLADIEAGLVDVVVVYKIDRLSRSLMDFARLVETFDQHEVTFVSVTQSFNTTTSMGRLTLNILLSFAQFEREVIGERVRDKIAASRARGMWMGGPVPLGYRVENRRLVVDEAGAAAVRRVFEGFAELGSATRLLPLLRAEGLVTKTGRPFDKGAVYKLLVNRTYLGEAVHKGKFYPGEHAAIIPWDLWDRVHAILAESPRACGEKPRPAAGAAARAALRAGRGGRCRRPTPAKRGGYSATTSARRCCRAARWRTTARCGACRRARSRGWCWDRCAPCCESRRWWSAPGARRGQKRRTSPRPRCVRRSGGSIPSGTSCSRASRSGSCGCWSSA